ncbi:hypothetical protein SLA2020_281060 [Shorea laevis]
MDNRLIKLEKNVETQATQWKQLKLDVNNILGHVKSKKTTSAIAQTIIQPIPPGGSSSSTAAVPSNAFGSGDEDEQMVDLDTDSQSSSLPPADAVTTQDRSQSRTKQQHDG